MTLAIVVFVLKSHMNESSMIFNDRKLLQFNNTFPFGETEGHRHVFNSLYMSAQAKAGFPIFYSKHNGSVNNMLNRLSKEIHDKAMKIHRDDE